MHVKKMYFAGETIEVEKTYSKKTGKHIKRAKREKPTPEKVKKYNEKKAGDILRRKVNTNFTTDDIHLVLTYKENLRPDPKQASRNLKYFLAKLRAEFKKINSELRYISITGYLDKDYDPEIDDDYTKHKEVAIHHHLIINATDYKIITKCWREFGRAMMFPLDEVGDYTELANYFIRHTNHIFRDIDSPCKKRWSCSRNLKEPILKVKEVKADSWREEPKPVKGYMIIKNSIQYGVSEITGYPYQFYRMIKINNIRK